MFTITRDGAGQLSGYFRRFGEVAAHRASQCIYQDTFHLMDGLGGQIVIVKVTHKGTEHLGCPVHGYSSRMLISLTTCRSRKPIATVIRKMSGQVSTPPVVHRDDGPSTSGTSRIEPTSGRWTGRGTGPSMVRPRCVRQSWEY